MIVISCHADTGFPFHRCTTNGQSYTGMMDNFSGVYAVMRAFFSGRINQDYVRIELTHGEEVDFAGAYEVLETLNEHDVVIVIDVTATPTEKNMVIEKCRNDAMKTWIENSLEPDCFDLYPDCPDPVADEDETDVYSTKLDRVFFLGIPCRGGDYNEEDTTVTEQDLDALSSALCDLIHSFPDFCEWEGIPVH